MKFKPATLRVNTERPKGEVIGDPDLEIREVATLEGAQPGDLTFVANAKYAKMLSETPGVLRSTLTSIRALNHSFAYQLNTPTGKNIRTLQNTGEGVLLLENKFSGEGNPELLIRPWMAP